MDAPRIGDATVAWRAGMQNRLVTLLLVALALWLPGGLALAFSDGSSAAIAIGIPLIAGGLALVAFVWWQQAGVEILLRPDGIERRGRFGARAIRWADLSHYVYTPRQRQRYYGGGLIGVAIAVAVELATKDDPLAPAGFLMVARDGTKVRVGPGIAGHKELIRRLVAVATEALFPSLRQRFDAGETICFGDRLTVRRGDGVTWRAWLGGTRTLPINRIERAQFLEGTLFVLRTPGKSWPWLRVAMQSVPNLFALVQLINHARQPEGLQQVPVGGERLPSAN